MVIDHGSFGEEQMAIDPRKVFVIHGRNTVARVGMFEFLRSIGLQPIEWEQAIALTGSGSPYIGQVLDAVFEEAQAVVVLQTPDDVAYLHDSLGVPGEPDCEPKMQARQNVTFEAGMAMGRNQDRTILVSLGEVRQFSDVHGRHYVRMDNTVQQRQALANRLKIAGCEVELTGSDWHTAGNLNPPAAVGQGLPLGKRLPSNQAAGVPQFRGTLHDLGGNRLSPLKITNLGPGTAFQVDVRPADEDLERLDRGSTELPIPRLPRGSTVKVMDVMPLRLAQRAKSYFEVVVSAQTEDGTAFEQTVFVSGD